MKERTIDRADAIELIERDESHFWDHKSASSSGSVFQKIGASLANADGGEFIAGIEDRKSNSGIDRWQGFSSIEDASSVIDAIARDVNPPIPYSVEFLRISNDVDRGVAVLVQVHKSDSVHYAADGKVYTRRSASTTSIAGRSVTDLSLSKGARSYEDQLLEDYTAEDIAEEEELSSFLETYTPKSDPPSFVRKQRLADRNSGMGRISAAILYAESPPAVSPKRCSVKVARYNTQDENPRREHLAGVPVTIEGPARYVIDETLRQVTEMFESVSIMQPDGSMAPVTYPPEALKEIIVNAVIHRDYNVSDDILVSVLNNRVEVKSPGALPGHMTLSNLLAERFSRNPTIVRLLNKYPDPPNKDIGEGLRTVYDKMAEAKLKEPDFFVEGGYFVAKLGHTPLARPQEIVMEYLQTHEEVTNSIGRKLAGITSENAMKDVFYSLRDAGQIERVPGKAGSKSAWRLVAPINSSGASIADESSTAHDEKDQRIDDKSIQRNYSGKRRKRSERPGRAPARNEPCPCGNGRKFKRCHGSPDPSAK